MPPLVARRLVDCHVVGVADEGVERCDRRVRRRARIDVEGIRAGGAGLAALAAGRTQTKPAGSQ